MPIAPMEANDDAGEVACGQIGDLAVERAALISHFERRQNPALLGIVEFGLSVNRAVIALMDIVPFFASSPLRAVP